MRLGFLVLLMVIANPTSGDSTVTSGRVTSGNVDATGGAYRVEGAVGDVFDILAFQGVLEAIALDFVDETPRDGTPDGWTVVHEYGAASAVLLDSMAQREPTPVLRITHTSHGQRTVVGYPIAGLIEPETWYHLSFYYRTDAVCSFGWRLATRDFEKTLNVLSAEVRTPVADRAWHRFASAPFHLPKEQLGRYPLIAFTADGRCVGVIDVSEIALEPDRARK